MKKISKTATKPQPENSSTKAYVWIWLPGQTKPLVAGVLKKRGTTFVFSYAKSYLDRPDKISILTTELPLVAGEIPLLNGLSLPSCLRDAAPDAWGRRVVLNRKFGLLPDALQVDQLDELTYLLESGSDRIGALDFQPSPKIYVARSTKMQALMNWPGRQRWLTRASL